MNPRRPSRAPGGASRGPGGSPSGDDTPAQTNLGMLLQRALQQAQQAQLNAQAAETTDAEEIHEAIEDSETKLCSNCWNAVTFKSESAGMMARCAKDLWIRPAFTLDDLNHNRIRRWYADCPEYDDSE